MKSQKQYWESKITEWEQTIYSDKKSSTVTFLERVASLFRKILKKSLEVAEKLVADHIKGKVVVDLGCASGIFLINLLKHKPKKLIGVDIAPSAIQAANAKAKELGITRKVKFVEADTRKKTDFLDNADIIIGIGFIDYLNQKELISLFKNIKNKRFLFSFPEKIISPRETLHHIYLRLASCPGSYKLSKKEMDIILKKAGIRKWRYYDKENIRFIVNLPQMI